MNPQVGPLLEIAFGSDPKTQEEAVSRLAKRLVSGFWLITCAAGARFEPSQYRSLTVAAQKARLIRSLTVTARKRSAWWAWVDSNYRPRPYQGRALTT
jgi:hypothetical protein